MMTDTCVVLHLQLPTSPRLPELVFMSLFPRTARLDVNFGNHVGVIDMCRPVEWADRNHLAVMYSPYIPRLYISTPLAFFVICMILLVCFKGTKRSLCFCYVRLDCISLNTYCVLRDMC